MSSLHYGGERIGHWGQGNNWLIRIVIKGGHSPFRTELSLRPFLRRRGVLMLYQRRREKNLVKNGEWEKETFCSAKAETLYLLKTMAAVSRLWCRPASQGNWVSLLRVVQNVLHAGQGAAITHGVVEEWCLCVPSHDRSVLRRPARTATRAVLHVPWLMSATRPRGLELAEFFP